MKNIKFKDSEYYQIMSPDMNLEGEIDLNEHFKIVHEFFKNIPIEQIDHKYDVNKWSVKEILGHLIDCHNLILYRILSFSRGEKYEINGADENLWVKESGHSLIDYKILLKIYPIVAHATQVQLELIPDHAFNNVGVANGIILKVSELFPYLTGHENHHIRVIKEKYL